MESTVREMTNYFETNIKNFKLILAAIRFSLAMSTVNRNDKKAKSSCNKKEINMFREDDTLDS